MDKQWQIEEMVEAMAKWAYRNGMLWHEGHAKLLAEVLLEDYQPKIPENAVVLTGDELRLYNENLERDRAKLKTIRKETAEKFAEMAKEEAFTVFMGEPIIRASKIDEICKEISEGV